MVGVGDASRDATSIPGTALEEEAEAALDRSRVAVQAMAIKDNRTEILERRVIVIVLSG